MFALACALAFVACEKKPVVDAAAETPAAPPAAPAQAVAPPPPIAEPLTIGSQDAKDDLYCAGVIFASNPESIDAVIPVEAARIMQAQNLAVTLSLAGTGKLIDQGVALAPQTGAVADAWADKAAEDFDARKPRISLEACTKRAEAVAPPQ